MNFLDAYDITDPAVTAAQSGPEPTLNEEVNQVVGQLSRFWGGFRKQSQSVLETARKDLGQVVSQAQKELSKLTTEPTDAVSDASRAVSEDASTPAPSDSAAPEAGPSSEESTTATEDSQTTPTKSRHSRATSVSAAAQNFLSRLQSSIPADLASTVQSKLPESIKQGASSIDFTQLRTTLATEFQRVQGVTRAQAEEYVHKSEELLRDAGEFLKEAVKVVPPEEGGPVMSGVMWDGSDIWMLPDVGPSTPSGSKGKGRERSTDSKSSADGLRAVATRAEALLKQLKHDPEVIRVDPEADERAAKMWQEWYSTQVESKEGGVDSPEWQTTIKAALDDPVDGAVLQQTCDTLVPSAITRETFWARYFFRVHQVQSEEQRRKALLHVTVESEEDFDWESDEEESKPTAKAADDKTTPSESTNLSKLASSNASHQTLSAVRSNPETAPSGADSPRRLSSEDSYDVVSSQVSNAESKAEESEGDDEGDEDEKEKDEEEDDEDEDEDEDKDEDEDEDEDEEGEDEDEEEEDEEEEEEQTEQHNTTRKTTAKAPSSSRTAADDGEDSDWE